MLDCLRSIRPGGYGTNAGCGKLAYPRITKVQPETLQLNLILSRRVGIGEALARDVVLGIASVTRQATIWFDRSNKGNAAISSFRKSTSAIPT